MDRVELKTAATEYAKANDYWTSNKTTADHINDAFMAGAAYAAQEVSDKDAKLKEASRIFTDYLTGKSSLRLFKADSRIFLHNLKSTGKEAGQDV